MKNQALLDVLAVNVWNQAGWRSVRKHSRTIVGYAWVESRPGHQLFRFGFVWFFSVPTGKSW